MPTLEVMLACRECVPRDTPGIREAPRVEGEVGLVGMPLTRGLRGERAGNFDTVAVVAGDGVGANEG